MIQKRRRLGALVASATEAGGYFSNLDSAEYTALGIPVQHLAVSFLRQRYGLSDLRARVTAELAGIGRAGAA